MPRKPLSASPLTNLLSECNLDLDRERLRSRYLGQLMGDAATDAAKGESDASEDGRLDRRLHLYGRGLKAPRLADVAGERSMDE